jgi:hypothetical protein
MILLVADEQNRRQPLRLQDFRFLLQIDGDGAESESVRGVIDRSDAALNIDPLLPKISQSVGWTESDRLLGLRQLRHEKFVQPAVSAPILEIMR